MSLIQDVFLFVKNLPWPLYVVWVVLLVGIIYWATHTKR